MRIAILIAASLLAGCAGPALHGNARGGVIKWFGTNHREVFSAAAAHCEKYGKTARVTEIFPRAGGHVLFDCM